MLQRVCARTPGTWRHAAHECSSLADLRPSGARNSHVHLLWHAWLPWALLTWIVRYTCHWMALGDARVLLNTRGIW